MTLYRVALALIFMLAACSGGESDQPATPTPDPGVSGVSSGEIVRVTGETGTVAIFIPEGWAYLDDGVLVFSDNPQTLDQLAQPDDGSSGAAMMGTATAFDVETLAANYDLPPDPGLSDVFEVFFGLGDGSSVTAGAPVTFSANGRQAQIVLTISSSASTMTAVVELEDAFGIVGLSVMGDADLTAYEPVLREMAATLEFTPISGD